MPPARRIRNPVTMDDLARRHQQIQAELAQIGITLPGSLTSRTSLPAARLPLPCRMGGLAWQWQPGRWQRVVRLVSEPGRVMPIWASSAWICWWRRAKSSMVTGFLIRRAGGIPRWPA